MTTRKTLLSTTLLTAMIALGAATAQAAGYALLEQSAESQGTSHAGSAARTDDPSVLFYNPAGMVKLNGYQFSINTTYIDPQATLQSGSATTNVPGAQVPVRGDVGHDAAVDALIPAIYGTAQVAPGWHVGLSVTSPFGLTTKYDSASIARYYGLTSSLRTIDVAPSVAWQPIPQLGLGASLIVETASARFSNAIDFGTIGAGLGLARFGLLPGGADGTATVKGSDTSVGYQLGALYDATPTTHIGLNYRSTIYHTLTGDIQFKGVPALLAPGFQNTNARAKLITPGSLNLSVAQDIGPVTVLAGATWTQWSRFRSLTVGYGTSSSTTDERWHDTATVSLGADWHVNDAVTLRTGVAYDQTPVPDSTRTPRIPDGDRFWLSVGGTWNVTKALSLTAAYTHIFVADTKVSLVDSGPVSSNFLRGNLTASYSNQINIFATSAKFVF